MKKIKPYAWLGIITLVNFYLSGKNCLAASMPDDKLYYKPQVGWDGMQTETLVTNGLIGQMINTFYDWLLSIVGIAVALTIMAAGFLWLTSGGNQTKISKAKQLISGSLTGLVILLVSWMLLNTINPDLIKTGKLEGIIKIGQVLENSTYYDKSAQHEGVYAEESPDGENQCCVIYGELDGSGYMDDTEIIHCASYKLKQTKAAKSCMNFYYNFKIGTLKLENAKSINPKTKEGAGSAADVNEKNYAYLFTGKACWEMKDDLKKLCQGKDAKDYCSGRENGITCLYGTNKTPGYCFNETCKGANEQWLWGKITNGNYCYTEKIQKGYVSGSDCLKCKKDGDLCSKDYDCCDGNNLKCGTYGDSFYCMPKD